MSITQKAVEFVARMLPDAEVDPLMRADRVIGQPMSRVDGPLKVTGSAQFTAEVSIDGMVHAALVCSTIAAGRIVDFYLEAAQAAPGVVLVMTHRNAPRMREAPLLLDLRGASFTRQPVMQDERVRWNGEPVAVIVAETREQALHAAAMVRVIYETAPSRTAFDPADVDAHYPDAVFRQPAVLTKGDAEVALKVAPHRIDQRYRTPWHSHAAIELHATTAHWHDDTHLTVYDASQAVTQTQATFAEVFDLRAKDIRVISKFVGGAFGNKMIWNHQLLCAAAAKLAKRPVRLMLTREDVFRVTGGRTVTAQRVALGARDDGTLTALIHTGVTTTGMKNGFPEQFTFPARQLYAAESFLIEQKVLELDTIANASMRAPGESVGSFALESALDELACQLGRDPVELRRRIEPTADPVKGRPFSARHLVEAYRVGAERFGWEHRSAAPRSRRDGEWWIGHGVATASHPYLRFPGAVASIRLNVDGTAVVRCAIHEMGMGTATVQAQHVAERLGLPFERVTFEYGDSDLPAGVPAGGSAQTASAIAAVAPAARELFKQLLRAAGNHSPLSGASVDDVVAQDSGLYRRDSGEGETYEVILRRAGRNYLECQGKSAMPFEMMKYSMHSYGAQFCELRVSDVTGEVRILRWLGSFDTGRIINPKTAASQFRGGIIMGLGAALTEETLVDERTGRVLNPSLAEYHVPVHADVPEIDVMWLNSPDPLAPMGGKGVGEIGITGVAAAVANAVYNASGVRIRELPITPDKVLAALLQL